MELFEVKMNKVGFIIYPMLLLLLSMASCSKPEEVSLMVNDTSAGTSISIEEFDKAQRRSGQAIVLKVDFESDQPLNFIEVQLVDKTANDSVVYNFSEQLRKYDKDYRFEHMLLLETDSAHQYCIEALSWKDENAISKVSQTYCFEVLP